MTALFNKLDTLSNYSFVPRPAQPEIKMINNQAAVRLEDQAVHMSSEAITTANAQITPEEQSNKSKKSANPVNSEERTKTDVKRQRREKRAKNKAIMSLKKNLEKPKEKIKPQKTEKLTSGKFFSKLQEKNDVEAINNKLDRKRKQQALSRQQKIAKLKL